jgi:glycosyltransferase involved in cell wall biosynthesis
LTSRKTTPVSKVLVAIPTYNPTGHDHYNVWRMVIDGLIAQRNNEVDVDIVVADNISTVTGRDILRKWQKEIPGLYLVFTEPRLPMNSCINHAWMLMKERGYDYYSYVCSDVIHTDRRGIRTLIGEMKELPDCAVMSCQVDVDMCDVFREINFFNPEAPATPLRITQGVNGHFYLYTKDFLKAYDWKKIDVLWGHRLEPFVSYQCSAIGKREYLSHKVIIHHYRETNENVGVERKDFESYDKPFETWGTKEDFLKMIDENMQYGLGFEELYQIAGHIVPETRMHNPDAFDEKGFAKSDTLYKIIKDKLFLKPEHLDYGKITHEFIG